jgi:hypothetical protein
VQHLDKCPQSISVQEVETLIKSERVETFDYRREMMITRTTTGKN